MDGLVRLGGWVDTVVAALALSAKPEYALRLCLEEAVANLVMHGVPAADADGSVDVVALGLDATPDTLCVTVEDDCTPFDPLQVGEPDRPATLEEAKIGGLGVHLMRHYARALEYGRVNGRNRLTLTIERQA
jgi:anti-sigma regulatory factor (Ser/Thr protein kinase)